jgi:Ser/Thr protein kinase RdoA (MazF antagonist)
MTRLAPAVLPNEAGCLITKRGERLAMLTEYAEGVCDSTLIPETEISRRIGSALASLHLGLRSLPPAEVAWPGPGDPTVRLRAAIRTHLTPTCPHTGVQQVLRSKLARALALPTWQLKLGSSLPQSVIHGDVHLGNLVLAEGRVAAFIDFDLTRTFPPVYELIRGLLYCVKPDDGPSAFTEQASAFLEGYLAIAPLSEAELAGMVPLFTTVQILDPHGLDTCQDASQELLSFGRTRFALLCWLDRYGPFLTDLARKVQLSISVRA